jgi:hypothetical protein
MVNLNDVLTPPFLLKAGDQVLLSFIQKRIKVNNEKSGFHDDSSATASRKQCFDWRKVNCRNL